MSAVCSHLFQTSVDEQQEGGGQSSARHTSAANESRPASQTRPITRDERSASQDRESLRAAASGSDAQPAEDKQAIEDPEVKAALRPVTEEGTNSRPSTGKGDVMRNMSSVSQGRQSSSKQRQRDAQLQQ